MPEGSQATGAMPSQSILTDAEHSQLALRLEEFQKHLQERTHHHLGYPYNLEFESELLKPFLNFAINNLGDPFKESNYGVHSREFELEVLNFFAHLWEIPQDQYWGYVTNCGTEGNLLGLLYGREKLPEASIFYSAETHYSVPKAGRLYRVPLVEVQTQVHGEMDYNDLRAKLKAHGDKPVIMNVNVGTTVKGAVDSLTKIKAALKEYGHDEKDTYIHVDGALAGLLLPFLTGASMSGLTTQPVESGVEGYKVSFARGVDSMSVSGHKMLGCPMPCGVVVTRKEHMERWETSVEYLNSTDTTIMGSRNGQAPIAMWLALQRNRGSEGLRQSVTRCVENARYLVQRLNQEGIPAFVNQLSSTVVFARPTPAIVKRWQLACTGKIAHVVVMPSTTKEKLDEFTAELIKDGVAWVERPADDVFKRVRTSSRGYAKQVADDE